MLDIKKICNACGRTISHWKENMGKPRAPLWRARRRSRSTVEYLWEMREVGIDLCHRCKPQFKPLLKRAFDLQVKMEKAGDRYHMEREDVLNKIRREIKRSSELAAKGLKKHLPG